MPHSAQERMRLRQPVQGRHGVGRQPLEVGEVDLPVVSYRSTLRSAIIPSGDSRPNARTTATALLAATARGSQRRAEHPGRHDQHDDQAEPQLHRRHRHPQPRQPVRVHVQVHPAQRGGHDDQRQRTQGSRGRPRTSVRSRAPVRGAQRRASAITSRVSRVAMSSCQKPWRAYSAYVRPVSFSTLS